MSQVRFGLIGTGRIGQVHAQSIAALGDAVLTWVADPLIEGAERTAALYGGRATANSEEVLGANDVDAVIIASPTPTHVELIDRAITAGVPALCEKPIDLDIARVDGLRNRARTSGVPIVLGFNRRFDPHFAELHRRVEAGEIGRLEQLAITSRDPEPAPLAYIQASGGIFRDMTIHDFDMARFFVPEIVQVTARGANQFSEDIRSEGDYDAVVVTLAGAGGEQIVITNSRHSAYGYDQRLEAFGAKGLLQVGNIADAAVRLSTATAVDAGEPYQNFFLQRYAAAYRLELEAFIAKIQGRQSASPGFEDGRAALLLANAAEESARTGRTIDVDLSA